MQDQAYINYLKEEVERHVSLVMKGEKMLKDGEIHVNLMMELSCYRKHIAFMANGLKKLGVSESERQSLVTPILKEK